MIYYQKGLDGEPKVFLDPNKMSEDGTAAVSLFGASKDNKYMAYAINQSGSDWQQINVMEIASVKKMDDVIRIGLSFQVLPGRVTDFITAVMMSR